MTVPINIRIVFTTLYPFFSFLLLAFYLMQRTGDWRIRQRGDSNIDSSGATNPALKSFRRKAEIASAFPYRASGTHQ